MSLEAYQEIFCRMVASAAFRDRVIGDPDKALDGFDLTERERRRLLTVASQPGMRVNTAIHRANRLTPLDQTLPLTCFLLGERLRVLLDRYWLENPAENLQAPAECERFSAFLEREMLAGRVTDPYLEEVLRFERTCTRLRFFTEAELGRRGLISRGLPPLVSVVTFRHDPLQLLEALANFAMPPANIIEGEFPLLIDCRSGEVDFRLLDAAAVAAIRQAVMDESASPGPVR